MATRPPKQKLSRDDWIEAALQRIPMGGLSAISVEPIAKLLKTTKGSFYWHFRDRNELVAAALDRWAIEDTRKRINELNEITNPEARLRTLMSPRSGEPTIAGIDLALSRSSLQEVRVRRAIQKNHELWLEFATKTFVEIGFSRAEARHRGVLAYSAYLGLVSLEKGAAGIVGNERRLRGYLRFVQDLLVK